MPRTHLRGCGRARPRPAFRFHWLSRWELCVSRPLTPRVVEHRARMILRLMEPEVGIAVSAGDALI